MRIYIAGPMRGYPYFNFAEFDHARDEVQRRGHEAISPADLDRAIGFDPYDPASVARFPIDQAFTDAAIRRDIDAILTCDAIVLLDGWQRSIGAQAEKAVAQWRGLTVYYRLDFVPTSKEGAA